MPASTDDLPWPALERARRAVVVVDMVESVRLMETNEEDTVQRWQHFVGDVSARTLPAHGGRLVKSLGDGLLCEYPDVASAVRGAFAMQAASRRLNDGYSDDQAMHVRIGAHTSDVFVDKLDIYGTGVNLAARLTSIAGPGQVVVSGAVHDQLTPGLDAEFEDLGECHVKHLKAPVRAWLVSPPGEREPLHVRLPRPGELKPTIAVIPFAARSADPEHGFLGDALADEVITALSKTPELNVISRLSSAAFRDRNAPFVEIGTHLGADYVLSGAFRADANRLHLNVELAETHSGHVAWADSLQADTRAIFSSDDDLIRTVVASVSTAVLSRELERAATQPLPTLQSYTLMLGAIALMHRLSLNDFDRARLLLEHLAERIRRSPVGHAWLAKWHVLSVVQGWSKDAPQSARDALDCSKRALDADPDSSLALTMRGLVQAYLSKDLEAASASYDAALDRNPNESLGWLFKGTLHAFLGDGAAALPATQHAQVLSPLDPMRYFYDSLSASAAISAGRYDEAIGYAQRSLRANRTHTSTFRSLAIAQSLSGRNAEAQVTIARLLELEPGFTVQRFLDRYPGRDHAPAYTQKLAEALRTAGLTG